MSIIKASTNTVSTGVKANSLNELKLQEPIEIEYVVIGGGGGSAGAKGGGSGGAGAGGYISSYASEFSGRNSSTAATFKAFPRQSYAVSIGGGGAGGAANYNSVGQVGTDSYFDTVKANGGGTSSGNASAYPRSGGAGAGAGGYLGAVDYSDNTQSIYARGSGGSLNQGFDGGNGGYGGQQWAGGGGGGAAGGGGNFSYRNGGNGGAGRSSSITGTSVARAGGGGGGTGDNSYTAGTGGTGGGGNGATATNQGQAGTVNTGGGGGGSSGVHTNARVGATGGSGVVILRFDSIYEYDQTGLTISESTDGTSTVLEITAGTGTISFR